MPDRTILAFDTSAAHCAAALLSGGQIVAEAFEEMPRGQAERLMPMVAVLLDRAGVALADLDAIGVGIGPGNFTGIRVAVSAARGLALGAGVPAVGVSGFDLLAEGVDGRALAHIAAPRGAFYLQWVEDGAPQGAPWLAEEPHESAGGDIDWSTAAARIARLAAARLNGGGAIARPAPLYIRDADAAPARPVPPVR
ncbi:tRNA threonylcarbamoyl adenosine modification protein YeaZ [Palleronia marisminoris]|uniref:tRNA threonylcarbamoyladenosine biosynthesis protein TsaB n=1 Tax=Palleronia marisminoris TaxID=315423 RepID=A0A1Y5RUS6_9RHOB|nr:tRNA (adenosine(37)-N6)-threonylcarbamoyltransferase complex dimerization subunit type 1 TsaB [Palleronia marisminoris]SFG47048.1 tRNA threonylcarbamoyl adenosine modification protein YeaZ [Palleronia marisminoris]SLN25555.1 tRNA threonylcarbamoyladenosine biosynthesis protein TsaB [Palleronia marisminoris]